MRGGRQDVGVCRHGPAPGRFGQALPVPTLRIGPACVPGARSSPRNYCKMYHITRGGPAKPLPEQWVGCGPLSSAYLGVCLYMVLIIHQPTNGKRAFLFVFHVRPRDMTDSANRKNAKVIIIGVKKRRASFLGIHAIQNTT